MAWAVRASLGRESARAYDRVNMETDPDPEPSQAEPESDSL